MVSERGGVANRCGGSDPQAPSSARRRSRRRWAPPPPAHDSNVPPIGSRRYNKTQKNGALTGSSFGFRYRVPRNHVRFPNPAPGLPGGAHRAHPAALDRRWYATDRRPAAADLGVSRTSLRRPFTILEAAGLLHTQAGERRVANDQRQVQRRAHGIIAVLSTCSAGATAPPGDQRQRSRHPARSSRGARRARVECPGADPGSPVSRWHLAVHRRPDHWRRGAAPSGRTPQRPRISQRLRARTRSRHHPRARHRLPTIRR